MVDSYFHQAKVRNFIVGALLFGPVILRYYHCGITIVVEQFVWWHAVRYVL